jgi:hypothetical protein
MYEDGEFSYGETSFEQILHDETIKKVAERLKKDGLSVKTNLSTSKRNFIKLKNTKSWPDIFIIKNKEIKSIYEVETINSANRKAVEKWKLHSSGKAPLFLIIPEEKLKTFKTLAKQNNIVIKDFITYNFRK